MYGGYEVHSFADIFPLIEGEEFAALVEDVEHHGLHEPILIAGGQLVDGRNRWHACQAAEVEPRFEDLGEMPEEEILELIVSKNVHRRHLNPSQLAWLALQYEEQFAQVAKGSQGKRTDLVGASSDDFPADRRESSQDARRRESAIKAAKAVGASPRLVQRAKRIAKHDPDAGEGIWTGKTTVNAAEKKITEAARSPQPEPADSEAELVQEPHNATPQEDESEAKRWAAPEARRIVKQHGIERAGALYWALADAIYDHEENIRNE